MYLNILVKKHGDEIEDAIRSFHKTFNQKSTHHAQFINCIDYEKTNVCIVLLSNNEFRSDNLSNEFPLETIKYLLKIKSDPSKLVALAYKKVGENDYTFYELAISNNQLSGLAHTQDKLIQSFNTLLAVRKLELTVELTAKEGMKNKESYTLKQENNKVKLCNNSLKLLLLT